MEVDKMVGFGSILRDYLEYNKISQSDFADRLGISQKHMNEIIQGNVGISKELIIAISNLTKIDMNFIVFMENKREMELYLDEHFSSQKEIREYLNSFFIKELEKNHWIELKDKESNVQTALDLLNFLNIKDFSLLDEYMDKKVLYKKQDKGNQRKIYLWMRHCDSYVAKAKVEEYDSSKLDNLLLELKKEQQKPFQKESLIKILGKYGIILIIEEALPGTKVRGAMSVKGNHPCIYMTTYLKNKSSFYYALYRELKHVKTDYNKLKNKIMIDDDVEEQADSYALEQMIPSKIYQEIMSNYKNRSQICKENHIPLDFLYSRLAYEKKVSYAVYNKYKERI